MSRRITIAALVALTALLSVSSVFADDLNPPPWRGQPGTTFQEWKFSTPDPAAPPDSVNNPYGQPVAHAYPGTGQSWVDVWGGRQGVWPLSGTIEIEIPNSRIPNPYKDIWVQLTWAKQVSSSTPVVWDLISGAHAQVTNQVVLGPTGSPVPSDLWYHTTFVVRIYPNPEFEVVKIDGTLLVDQVVVDTICVPEPSSLVAMASGLIGLIGFSIRRRK